MEQNPFEKNKSKLSQKEIDIFCRELLEQNPELKIKIVEKMEKLKEGGEFLPIVHITSRAIRSEQGGDDLDTGFLENIKNEGFHRRDTNVAVFVRRGTRTSPAEPDFYIEKPEEFIKALRIFLQRYSHHGLRTNKNILGENRDSGQGVPIAVVIDGSVPIEHGSDYDDHYILKSMVTPDKILGEIDLDGCYHSQKSENIIKFAKALLELI